MMLEFLNHAVVPLAANINNTSKAINGSLQIPMSLPFPEIHFICTMHLQDLGYYLRRKKKAVLYKHVVRKNLIYFLGLQKVHQMCTESQVSI